VVADPLAQLSQAIADGHWQNCGLRIADCGLSAFARSASARRRRGSQSGVGRRVTDL
jgi:hypothetical protein